MKLSLGLQGLRFVQVVWQGGKYDKNLCCPGWLDPEWSVPFVYLASVKYQGIPLLKKIYSTIYTRNYRFTFTLVRNNLYDVKVWQDDDLVQRHYVKIVEPGHENHFIKKVFF